MDHIMGLLSSVTTMMTYLISWGLEELQERANYQVQERQAAGNQVLRQIDLPGSFVQRLLTQHLDRDSKLALFQSCRELRDLVMDCSACTRLHLRFPQTANPAGLAALRRANAQHNAKVKLHFGKRAASSLAYRFLKRGQQQGIMRHVTQLTLDGLHLDTLLPPEIAETCPNLVHLSLKCCIVKYGWKTSFCATIPKLQTLHLQVTYVPLKWTAHLHQQLARHTALRSLVLDMPKVYDPGCSLVYALAHQLTFLHIMEPVLGPVFTALEAVHIELGPMYDEAMEQLLQIPSLKRVELGFCTLNSSFAGRDCVWEELTLNIVEDVTLARMPLHANLVLKLQASLTFGSSLDMVQAAVANAAKCGKFCWKHDLVLLKHDGVDDEQLWSQALLLLKDAAGLCLWDIKLSSSVATAMSSYVQGRGPLNLHLFSHASGTNPVLLSDGEAEAVLHLASMLPAGSTLDLGHMANEALITKVCSTAAHALTLVVKDDAGQLVDRVKAVMRQHGHENVTVLPRRCRRGY